MSTSVKREGVKHFIDQTVLDSIEPHRPQYMTRTAWINLLLQEGLAAHTTRHQ